MTRPADLLSKPDDRLTRISHHLTVEARHKPAITALRLLAVLNVLPLKRRRSLLPS